MHSKAPGLTSIKLSLKRRMNIKEFRRSMPVDFSQVVEAIDEILGLL